MWIDVKIPYEPDSKLAYAYNRAMENTTAEWVLLLDQDVFLCNPYWYEICLKAIEQLEETNVGLITCMTSGEKQKKIQRVDLSVFPHDKNDIEDHIRIAHSVYENDGMTLKEVKITITGFFMLIRKSAWEKVKFKKMVNQSVGRIDIDFSRRLLENGFSIYLLLGLYVYHRRGMRKLKW